MSKRILSLVLALVMVLGTFGTVFAAPTDNERVDWLIAEGLVKGYGDGTYGLDKAITRAEVATMVVRALGFEEDAAKMENIQSVFPDMRGTNVKWANGYVNLAVGKGIINGYEDGSFKPSQDISYAEVAAILVRALNGMTPAEVAAAKGRDWATTYLVRAAELGVLDNVVIADFNAKALRETIFEMVYNTINKGFGRFTIVKAIVLENNRVERLAKNEIVVEVIEQVQKANQLDAVAYGRGDQEKLVIDVKLENGDVENLLGRVANFTLDKTGKVIKVTLDDSYAIEIIQAKASKNKFGRYTVEIGERYKGTDERIYRTYLNNKAYSYEDFYTLDKDNSAEFAVDYARATIKNGKVLFIDAFNFEDVMPVKELKDIREKAAIVAYDDVREGKTIEIGVSDKEIILVKNNMLSKGTLEDVKLDNVIHTFKDGATTQYLVLQDLAIEGKLDRITETKVGNAIVSAVIVDGKSFDIPTDSPKRAVYEFKSNDKFYTLDAKTAYRELDTFRGEQVRVLLGLDGKVQYIGSPVAFGDFVGIATRIVGREMRVLNPENKLNDYTATLDTKVDALVSAGTGHQNLNEIKKNALVYVNANDETLVEVVELMNPVAINTLNARTIGFGQGLLENSIYTEFRITDDTAVYVINSNGVAEVRAIADVVKAYDLAVKTGKTVSASLVTEGRYDNISIRGDKYARNDNAFAIAFYNLDISPKLKDSVYGKLIRFYDRAGRVGESEIVVQLTNGREETFKLDKDVDVRDVNFTVGQYYEIQESKDTALLAVKINKVRFDGHGEITNITGNVYTINGMYFYEVRATEFFGPTPKIGNRVSYVVDSKYSDLKLVVNPAVEADMAITGMVTYINPTGTRLEVDKKVYVLDANTRLFDEGMNTIAIGNLDIANDLAINDLVKDIKVNNGVVTSLVKVNATEFYKLRAATAAVVKAEDSKLQADVNAAQLLINTLAASPAKTALQVRLTAVVPEVVLTNLQKATVAVVKAEMTRLQSDYNTAQALVTALPAGSDKAALQARINVIVPYTGLQAATAAVVKAEGSMLQADKDAAQLLVNGLPADANRIALQSRLNVITSSTQLQVATAAVVKAEGSMLQADKDAAQLLVNGLPADANRVALQSRLNAIIVVAAQVGWAVEPQWLLIRSEGKLTIPASMVGTVVVKNNGAVVTLAADGSFQVPANGLISNFTVEVNGVEVPALSRIIYTI